MAKILHVTEALGGGVATAIAQYMMHAPQHQHALLAAAREGVDPGVSYHQFVAFQKNLPRALWGAVRAIRETYHDWRPDFVHLHSSFAGGYGRLAGLPWRSIIYTPHGYAFNSLDFSPFKRTAYFAAEMLLSLLGQHIAGVSPYEVACAKKVSLINTLHLLPNAITLPHRFVRPSQPWQKESGQPLRVMMVGRVLPVKDPAFFAAVARRCAEKKLPVQLTWLGGGDEALEKHLAESGVQVSGWLSRDEILEKMIEADVYCHTAAWEALPVKILEAAMMGKPIFVRDITALSALGLRGCVETPLQAAEMLKNLCDGEGWDVCTENQRMLQENYSPDVQRQALAALYG